MNVTGIVAEYNPFHNGHLYHLTRARKDTGADYIIVVLSGDFVQRGAPAILDKYARTKMALLGGADLVLELPVCYAVSSADYYAGGAATLLDRLGVVDCLSFGSEHGRIEDLCGIAALSAHETPAYSVALNHYMVEGKSFAYANMHALMDACGDERLKAMISSVLREPNNSLGISYIKTLMRRTSGIKPHTIFRAPARAGESEGVFSAMKVRSDLMRTGDIRYLDDQVPDYVLKELMDNHGKTFPLTRNDFSDLLLYKLRSLLYYDDIEPLRHFETYQDVSRSTAARIAACINQYENFKQFTGLLKTKNVTYASISRSMIHILLDLKKDRMQEWVDNDYVPYARVLGFRESATPLLSQIKKNSEIPLVTKIKDAASLLDPASMKMLRSDIFASELYEQIAAQKFSHPFRSEYTREIVICHDL